MNGYGINFKRMNLYSNKENILAELYKLESCVAAENNRKCATFFINNGVDCPIYDYNENTITLPERQILPSNIIQLLVSTRHESEHANQTLSVFRTDDEKTLISISNAVYEEKTEKGKEARSYSNNYKEMGAKLAEARFLIDLYKSAIDQTKIINLSLAKDFISTINETISRLNKTNWIGIQYIKHYNKSCIKNGEYIESRMNGLSKKDALKFLRKTAPKMYKGMLKEIEKVKKELFEIRQEMEFLYGKDNIGRTSNKLSALKILEREQYRNDIEQMYDNQVISHISVSPYENHNVYEFDCYDGFKEFVDKTLDNNKSTEIYTQIDINSDKYTVFIPLKKPSFADNVLEGEEKHELTTFLENINIEK
jgi:hypothetical protein